MAPKAPKKKNNLATAAVVMAACVLTASLAFISLELAALAAGFITMVGFVRSDIGRRRFWENSISFKMKRMGESHSSLDQKITSTRQDILNIRQHVADLNRRINEQEERIDTVPTAAPQRGPIGKTLINETLSSPPKPARRGSRPDMPHASRAGQKPVVEQTRAAPVEEAYNDLSDMVVRELVSHAVRSRTIDVFVQPIVRLPQRKVRFYEMYARVRARPGMYLPAKRYMNLARENQLSNDIDNMLLMECLKTIQSSAHIERAAPLFMNISGATLKNTTFMKRLLTFLSANRHLAPRLVFEIAHEQYKKLEGAPREILRGIGQLGCAVSLDNVDVLDFDIAELQRYHVRFVKISAKTVMPYTRSDRARVDLQKQKRKLESNGVSVIIDKIETESDLVEMLDLDISYGQGFLFGRPDLEAAYRKRRAA